MSMFPFETGERFDNQIDISYNQLTKEYLRRPILIGEGFFLFIAYIKGRKAYEEKENKHKN